MKKLAFLIFVFAAIVGSGSVFAANLGTYTLSLGDMVDVVCNGGNMSSSRPTNSLTRLRILCSTTATPTPVPSAVNVALVVYPNSTPLQGKAVSGKVAIEAKTSADVAKVTFTLKNKNGVVDTHTEMVTPFFYKGDNLGNPYYWDTTGFSGAYELSAEATTKTGQVGVTASSFTVGTSVPGGIPTPTTIRPQPTTGPGPQPTSAPQPGGGTVSNEFCNDPAIRFWHAPGAHPCSYLKTGHPHEHGDAPPAWVTSAGFNVTFAGMHNTSPVENTVKHASMKGFATTYNGMDVYLISHFSSVPMERFGSYHSYQFWMRPAGDNNPAHVSNMQGWTFTGLPNSTDSRCFRRKPTSPCESERPIILVADRTAFNQGITCEQWYNATADWSIDFGITICNSATYYVREKEQSGSATLDANGNLVLTGVFDRSTWEPTGSMGLTRRLELAWYGPGSKFDQNRGNPPKDRIFYATQFGEMVSSKLDARCSGSTVGHDGKTYPNTCLPQYISSSARVIEFPGNAVQKDFPGDGIVQLPN